MKIPTLKISKLLELKKINVDDLNFSTKSKINDNNFKKLNDEIFKNKDDVFNGDLFINNNLKKKIIIVSHERSGTHYLMNSIAYNSGYTVHPFIPISNSSLSINLQNHNAIHNFFSCFEKHNISNIFKSHHHFDFYKKEFDYLKEHFFFIYIYRDPRDIMVSFWNFLKVYPWVGPKKETIFEFLKSKPEGSMIQYQLKQYKNILERWGEHVKSWLLNNDKEIKRNILFIKYEDLNLSFEKTLKQIFSFINIKNTTSIKPSTSKDVLSPGRGKVGNYRFFLDNQDLGLFNKNIRKTMLDLGYFN